VTIRREKRGVIDTRKSAEPPHDAGGMASRDGSLHQVNGSISGTRIDATVGIGRRRAHGPILPGV
jgi:hypothetical protein